MKTYENLLHAREHHASYSQQAKEMARGLLSAFVKFWLKNQKYRKKLLNSIPI